MTEVSTSGWGRAARSQGEYEKCETFFLFAKVLGVSADNAMSHHPCWTVESGAQASLCLPQSCAYYSELPSKGLAAYPDPGGAQKPFSASLSTMNGE